MRFNLWDSLNNICLLTDSYKVSHWKQYQPRTETIYAYLEARKGAKFAETVYFSTQYYLDQFIAGPVVTNEKLDYAVEMYNPHFGCELVNVEGWRHIINKWGGHLPVRIKAVDEGTVVPVGNVLMTIENTDPKCFWLTNYLESLLVQTWYGCTVATQSREMKKIILKYLHKTGDPSLIDYKLHDFGFRGVSSVETAAIGGAAHLTSFKGTDTFAGVILANKVYGCPMAGNSIPAAEHSTITSWGKTREAEAYANMLRAYPEEVLVAVVSDSYDIVNACENIWGGLLRDAILSRKGTLVIRPDSGDPPTMVCMILEILWKKFGGIVNQKGYRVLDPHVRIIQGDGIDFEMLELILSAMEKAGFSADNIAFGSGGGLLQKVNRDTQRFAFKCSSTTVAGKEMDVFKNPTTDPTKASMHGRLRLIKTDGKFGTVNCCKELPPEEEALLIRSGLSSPDYLSLVFENGHILKRHTFDEIRTRCAV